jgi:methyl-accepting chemotaxis protein
MPELNHETIQLAFIVVTALAVLLQAIILLAIFFAVRKAARSLKEEVEDLRSSVLPLIYNTRELYTRLAPKFESAVGDLAEMASGLRVQTARVEATTTEIVERIRHQTIRLDTMLSSVLDAIDRAGGFVAETVSRPVRQLSAIMASIKAILESLRNSSAEPLTTHTPGDNKEPFV